MNPRPRSTVPSSAHSACRRRSIAAARARIPSAEQFTVSRTLVADVTPVMAAGRGAVLVMHDITELRKADQVRRDFVANVSHELRTPLASIKALVETLEAGAIDEREVAVDFLGRIVGEVDRLAALVDELLDLARLESGRITLRLETLEPANLIGRGAERLKPQTERARLLGTWIIESGIVDGEETYPADGDTPREQNPILIDSGRMIELRIVNGRPVSASISRYAVDPARVKSRRSSNEQFGCSADFRPVHGQQVPV